MDSVYLIEYGVLCESNNTIKWEKVQKNFFLDKYSSEKYLSDYKFEKDADGIYFTFDTDSDITVVARLIKIYRV